jgi:gelsolin
MLLRIFRQSENAKTLVVHEVEPTWRGLGEEDEDILDRGDGAVCVWQGRKCSPMEKAKAAQVVHDMTQAKHVDVEVLSQDESRALRIVQELGGTGDEEELTAPRPVKAALAGMSRPKRLLRLSDASGQLAFELVREGESVSEGCLDEVDVFLLDDVGREIWVWEGRGASTAEKAL